MFITEAKRVREERKLTLQQVATLTGVPLGTITRIFAEDADDFKFYTAVKIAVGLGISIDKCVGISTYETDTPEPPVLVPPVVDVVKDMPKADTVSPVVDWHTQALRERKEKGILFCALLALVGAVVTFGGIMAVASIV